MLKQLWLVAGLLAGSLAVGAPVANAATVAIAGVKTDVAVTAPLGTLGLSAAPFGSATADTSGVNPVFSFPITGGTVDTATGAAIILHDGSGVTLSAGSISATVGNFLIDTAAAEVLGDLIDAVSGTSLATALQLFTFGTSTALPGVELLISDTLAGALITTFGAPNLTGAQFGFATPDVAAVPLPAAGVLLAGAVAAIAAAALRRKRAA
jgi:hypothetical protein